MDHSTFLLNEEDASLSPSWVEGPCCRRHPFVSESRAHPCPLHGGRPVLDGQRGSGSTFAQLCLTGAVMVTRMVSRAVASVLNILTGDFTGRLGKETRRPPTLPVDWPPWFARIQ